MTLIGVTGLMLTLQRMASRGLLFHWRSALSIALGVATATAVIAGALMVGDSMRGSLRELTAERLGAIDYMLVPGAFFEAELADRLEATVKESEPSLHRAFAAPLMVFTQAVLETADAEPLRRSGSVQVIGCDDRFWKFANEFDSNPPSLDEDSVILNATAAQYLQVKAGDFVTVRLPTEQAVPADNPLGRRDVGTESIPRLKVAAVLPEHGFGRFALQPSQQPTATAFLALSLVQDTLERDNQANAILLSTGSDKASQLKVANDWAKQWNESLPLQLNDYGLKLEHIERKHESDRIFSYWSLTSDRLILADPIVERLSAYLGSERTQPVMTYLANLIVNEKEGAENAMPAEVAYSMITGINDGPGMELIEQTQYLSTEHAAMFLGSELPSERVPVVLNQWAADRLKVAAGDPVRIDYFAPETVGGLEVKQSMAGTVAGIVPITKPSQPYSRRAVAKFDQPPTRFNDPDLTPSVPGVTDQDSILDWDLPFALDKGKITNEDDRYWNEYRLTPKVLVPYAIAKQKFGSRFGHATSLMIADDVRHPVDEQKLRDEITGALKEVRGALGWNVQPVRALQFSASRGSTPFDVLFLSLSFFVIVAAMLLIVLMLRLAVEQRAAEYGTLLAMGWSSHQVARLAIREYLIIVVLGSAMGIALGIGYASLVLYLLRTWWVGAVTVPFLKLFITPTAIGGGFIGGCLMGGITVMLTLRRLSRAPARNLLSGSVGGGAKLQGERQSRWIKALAALGIVGGCGLAIGATQLQGQSQSGAFVAGGMLLLIGFLAAYRLWLARKVNAAQAGFNVWQLAMRNGRRQPLRSVLTASLIAIAGFLVLSMGAFRLDPTQSGTGGFDLMASTAQPIARDLNQSEVRRDMLGREASSLESAQVLMVRERVGQDASCNNLYQATEPRVLGLPESIKDLQASAEENAFRWAAGDGNEVWETLATKAAGTEADPVPVVIDQNTALWSLKMYGGVGEVRSFSYDGSEPIHFRVVGLLSNSILQGSLIVSEANFVQLFPNINGYRQMLIRSGNADPEKIGEVLENRLGDAGVDVEPTAGLLARLLEVQNTYLRTFQGLGALGLLLGTFGLAAAQIRSVMERRGEFALLRAVGFTQQRVSRLVMLEAVQLLVGGLLIAVIAAGAALIPYAIIGRAQVGWQEPAALLSIVLCVGIVVSAWAAHRAVSQKLLPALKGD